MIIDPNRTPLADIVALVLNRNPACGMTVDNVIPGTPVSGTYQTSVGVRNTKLVLSAAPGSGMKNSATVYYNRTTLTQSIAKPSTLFEADTTTASPALILSAIIEALDLIATEVTLSGDTDPPTDGSTITILQLVPNPNSLVYDGAAVPISIKWTTDLSKAVINVDLDGFDMVSS